MGGKPCGDGVRRPYRPPPHCLKTLPAPARHERWRNRSARLPSNDLPDPAHRGFEITSSMTRRKSPTCATNSGYPYRPFPFFEADFSAFLISGIKLPLGQNGMPAFFSFAATIKSVAFSFAIKRSSALQNSAHCRHREARYMKKSALPSHALSRSPTTGKP